MWDKWNKTKRVIREVLSEPNGGTLSWGRIASSVLLVASLVWVTRVLILTHGLPSLDGITGLIIGPYTANKVGTAVQSFSSNPVNISMNTDTNSTAPVAQSIPAPPPMIPPPSMMSPPNANS